MNEYISRKTDATIAVICLNFENKEEKKSVTIKKKERNVHSS